MLNVPVNAPCTAGVKLTVAEQLEPAATVAQLWLTAKWVEAVMELTATAVAPALASVTVFAGAVVFIDWPPKSTAVGLAWKMVTDGVATLTCWKTALEVTG
jgi:hypothetical protein